MGWAFWRADGKPARARGAQESDEARALRVRARRRLIGAAVLLLTTAIVVPLLLDPAPRPVSDNIAIDIPSDRQPFTPRLPSPAVPAAEPAPPTASAEPPTPKAAEAAAKDTRPADAAREGKHLLQAAALSSESAARELSERLRKAGFAPFTEKIETRD
ncbi:MAG: hypothetical protein NZL99_01725, partial [Burkholderiaceae bacterium]|nr:hypothetical protein [Burkholderiaceae bacterium]